MDKAFFEVFPTLKLNKNLQELFEETFVTRVVSSSRKDRLRIYLSCRCLIEKDVIYTVEREIVRQLFPKAKIKVTFMESFHLTGRYTTEGLLSVYKNSILLELKNYDHFEYQLFYHAELEFPEDTVLKLVLEDTIVARSRSEELVRILDKILNERCGISTEVYVSYREAAPKKARKNAELKMQEEVSRIVQMSKDGAEAFKEGEPEQQPAEERTTDAPEPVKAVNEKNKFEKKNWPSRRGSRIKKSDNPDVIYGYDFNEEPVVISEIDGEIGEIIVKGQIIRFETRDTRNEKKLVIFDVTDFTDTITVKMFPKKEHWEKLSADIGEGKFVIVKGVINVDKFDGELTLGFVTGIKKTEDFTSSRM
ncbi:MAG TPA: PolC-type DNA polymerase III N-terminal domain-containing protein, partial [Lachnospiraceae bacterium]|nr:PolC-type DNA polymerase III N-terminal domain-containing protein [Lachnospiraceae bacterium]